MMNRADKMMNRAENSYEKKKALLDYLWRNRDPDGNIGDLSTLTRTFNLSGGMGSVMKDLGIIVQVRPRSYKWVAGEPTEAMLKAINKAEKRKTAESRERLKRKAEVRGQFSFAAEAEKPQPSLFVLITTGYEASKYFKIPEELQEEFVRRYYLNTPNTKL